uniref:Major facilitator superfamily (MFS) profile domain-containing protein n=1 Tax=Clastoptera arizonana TaxID=38151 RepID=A0A1B6C7Q8_9HEMI
MSPFVGSINKGVLRQYTVALISTIALFIGGTSIGWPNPVLPYLLSPDAPFPISRADITWVVSIIHIAFILSSFPTGYVMDRFGRKKSLLFLSIFPLSSYILTIFSTSSIMLCIARFLAGVWLGVIYTIVPMYLAEISEPQIRGSLGNFTSLLTYTGTLFAYVIGSVVSYTNFAIILGTIPVIFIVCFAFMPESPYYYLMIKNPESAKKSLMWLREGDEEKILGELAKISKAIDLEMEHKGNIKELFSTRGNRKALLITEVLSMNQKFAGTTAIIAFASVTLPEGALPSIGTDGCVIILGAISVVSGALLMFIIDRVGRKSLLLCSCLGCSVALLLLTVWYYLDQNTTVDVTPYNYIPFYCLCFHSVMYCLALGPIVNSIKGELFPSNVKAIASVITTIVLALSSFFVNKIYLVLADSFGFYLDFLMFFVITMIGAVFSLTVVVETKGKTLQDIQIELNGGKIIKDTQTSAGRVV